MEVDKFNLKEVILNSVRQLNAPLTFFNELRLTRRSFDKVLICGMGGSALLDDFFAFFKAKGLAALTVKIPVVAHASYALPPDADEKTLVLCVSYSGNTEETISSFREARSQNLEVVGLTSGGTLEELFSEQKLPWIKIPGAIPPRMSSGYQLLAAVKILMAYGLLTFSAENELTAMVDKLTPASLENPAAMLCRRLERKIPIIYASGENKILAKFWKIKFNENTKIPAFYNIFPELNHNEMNGWLKALGPFYFILLNSSDDSPKIKKRMEVTAVLLKKMGWPVEMIKVEGQNALAQLFWTSIFGDWLSYHLALFYGVDPTPVELVEEFKKMME